MYTYMHTYVYVIYTHIDVYYRLLSVVFVFVGVVLNVCVLCNIWCHSLLVTVQMLLVMCVLSIMWDGCCLQGLYVLSTVRGVAW